MVCVEKAQSKSVTQAGVERLNHWLQYEWDTDELKQCFHGRICMEQHW